MYVHVILNNNYGTRKQDKKGKLPVLEEQNNQQVLRSFKKSPHTEGITKAYSECRGEIFFKTNIS